MAGTLEDLVRQTRMEAEASRQQEHEARWAAQDHQRQQLLRLLSSPGSFTQGLEGLEKAPGWDEQLVPLIVNTLLLGDDTMGPHTEQFQNRQRSARTLEDLLEAKVASRSALAAGADGEERRLQEQLERLKLL